MKAVVFHGVGDIRLEDVPEPQIQDPTDAIVRITASAICGTDLHMIRGTMTGVEPGTVLGHEGVGVVEEVGPDVRNFRPGDRVVIASTIACGYCRYCREGSFSQCDNANPNGPLAGTAFYGGPKQTGPFQGLQAEKARIPFASVGMFKIPDDVTDEQAVLLSDVFPTGYFGADLADVHPGCTVAVFGCGPVGQFAVASTKLMGAGRIFAVDAIPSRLDAARAQGAEVINYNQEDPVEAIRRLTGGQGADCCIDAVGVDANHAEAGPAAQEAERQLDWFRQELQQIAPRTNPQDGNWHPGDAPSQASEWAVKATTKAGNLAIIGVYPQADRFFPIGEAMNKNLTVRMGNCNHRKYLPWLMDMVQSGTIDPARILTEPRSFTSVIDAYKAFDMRQPGWVKAALVPAGA